MEMSSETSAVLQIIDSYRLYPRDGISDRGREGNAKFAPLIQERVDLGHPITMVFPGFPFKSPDVERKVLGVLPDMAEEIALGYLYGMCEKIRNCYKGGVELIIISDGIVYSDILGVPDSTVWAYGQAVRKIVQDNGFGDMIKFARLHTMLDEWIDGGNLTEEVYLANADRFRHELDAIAPTPDNTGELARYLAHNEDAKITYDIYTNNILTHDLVDVHKIQPTQKEVVASRMIIRGKAYAAAIENYFPDCIRLSIHASSGRNKFSISLFPNRGSALTPWHAAIGIDLDKTIIAGPREMFDGNPKYELIKRNEIPYYYLEKSSLET